MKNSKVALIILFDKIVDLLFLLTISLDQPVRPFDHIKADGAKSGKGSPFLSGAG
jgi:hypothetical protein